MGNKVPLFRARARKKQKQRATLLAMHLRNIVLAQLRVLILDRNITPRGALVLVANEVGNLLVLGLLDSGLIALITLLEHVLLNVIDA